MADDLPDLKHMKPSYVRHFVTRIFSKPSLKGSQFIDLITFPQGYYRAIFSRDYFELYDEQAAPTKSQWSTLKKKMKRHDRRVFVLRETGEIDCGKPVTSQATAKMCFYLDFGFFAD